MTKDSQGGSTEIREKRKYNLNNAECPALVKTELHYVSQSRIRVAPMYQQQPLKGLEVTNCEIRCKRSLCAFLAQNRNAAMRSLNHGHIVAAVANCQSCSMQRFHPEKSHGR